VLSGDLTEDDIVLIRYRLAGGGLTSERFFQAPLIAPLSCYCDKEGDPGFFIDFKEESRWMVADETVCGAG